MLNDDLDSWGWINSLAVIHPVVG